MDIQSPKKRIVIPLNGEYFDAIQSGEKTEEYRLYTDYWIKRLVGKHYDEIVFTRGYPKCDDESRRMHFRYGGYSIKVITHVHFGAEPVEVFAIQFYEGYTKTKEQYELALKELADVCKKHGIFLIGTCENGGIYSEITIGVTGDKSSYEWSGAESLSTNTYIEGNAATTERIGET